MAKNNIDIVGSELVIERIVTLGNFSPYSISFESPTVELVLDRIKFYERGIYKISLGLTDINEIDSVIPIDLQDAYDKILVAIRTLGGGGALPSYKVYTALLTQSGTDAPVATVLENTLGGVPVWSRYTTGVAQAELIGAFTLEKTVVIPFAHVSSGSAGDTMKIYDDEGYSTDNVKIEQKNFAGGSIDEYTGVGVEIRVYN